MGGQGLVPELLLLLPLLLLPLLLLPLLLLLLLPAAGTSLASRRRRERP